MAGHPPTGLSLLTSAATGLRMNMNSVWATEKAAPVARSGFGIIPANLFYCTTARKNCSMLGTAPFMLRLKLLLRPQFCNRFIRLIPYVRLWVR